VRKNFVPVNRVVSRAWFEPKFDESFG